MTNISGTPLDRAHVTISDMRTKYLEHTDFWVPCRMVIAGRVIFQNDLSARRAKNTLDREFYQ